MGDQNKMANKKLEILVVEDKAEYLKNAINALSDKVKLYTAQDLTTARKILNDEPHLNGIITDLNYYVKGTNYEDRTAITHPEILKNLHDEILNKMNEDSTYLPMLRSILQRPEAPKEAKITSQDEYKVMAKDGGFNCAYLTDKGLMNEYKKELHGSPLGVILYKEAAEKGIPTVIHTEPGHANDVLPLLAVRNIISQDELKRMKKEYNWTIVTSNNNKVVFSHKELENWITSYNCLEKQIQGEKIK